MSGKLVGTEEPSLRNHGLNGLPILLSFVKAILTLIPQGWKPRLYNAFTRTGFCIRPFPTRSIFRLPFGLVLKISEDTSGVEANALRFVSTLHGIHVPQLVDYVSSSQRSYLLTTWVEGDCMGTVFDHLTSSDKDRIVKDLREQFRALKLQTQSSSTHLICNASGGPVNDPRVPWVAQENPRTFARYQDFAAEVWTGLDWSMNRDTLRPMMMPLIERKDVPIVFSHADLLPKNIIIPGGLARWRAGCGRVCIIDWEYAGWMPVYWDALKATWMSFEEDDDDWLPMARAIFPDHHSELDADLEWRRRSKVLIL